MFISILQHHLKYFNKFNFNTKLKLSKLIIRETKSKQNEKYIMRKEKNYIKSTFISNNLVFLYQD